MNRRDNNGWMKHWDFIVMDILCMQLSFATAYWIVHGFGNPYARNDYQYQAMVLVISQILVIVFSENYKDIIRRGPFRELVEVLKLMAVTIAIAVIYLFMVKHSATASRLQYGLTSVLFVIIDYLLRLLNKKRIALHNSKVRNRRSIVLVTGKKLVNDAIKNLNGEEAGKDFFISRIILLDGAKNVRRELDSFDVQIWDDRDAEMTEASAVGKGKPIPVISLGSDAIQDLIHSWVDEVLIIQPEDIGFPTRLVDDLMEMGIRVSYTMPAFNENEWFATDIGTVGSYKVLTNSVKFVSPGELALKRLMDIIGGLVGCVITGILFLFVAPAIYRESPGPIFFTQERVGKNGKTFRMHKFRSMYMDAEARKASLMKKNRIKDGMMFKMDDDPRIIGSKKKDKNGRPAGIGNFIRNTSIDEFPQFFDVLRGRMSLVGWRPCTVAEWEKYNMKHRIRASMKPGLTGMWQVSGRSEITDFNEVVKLDREYIENWSLGLDIKILVKTIGVVIRRKGAS